MSKLTLNDLTSLANETSAMTLINANNTAIEEALENTLSRDGTTPNMMTADLDMNSNRILNLVDATTAQEPVTLAQMVAAVEGGDATTLNGQTPAYYLSRTNHTGTQTASTISDFNEAVDDRVGALVVAGTNATVNYNDGAGTLTVNATSQSGRFLRRTYYDTAGSFTWNKGSDVGYIEVELKGAGGGGAGIPATSAANAAIGGPGGTGGESFKTIVAASLGASETVTVGAGGAGGVGGTNGSQGGVTSFGAHLSATAGSGGATMTAGTTGLLAAQGGAGTGSSGDKNITGGTAGFSYRLSATQGYLGLASFVSLFRVGGIRGSNGNLFVVGPTSITPSATNADNGRGGQPALSLSGNVGAIDGQPGGPGLIIVTEYA